MRGHWAIPVLASILIIGSFGVAQQASAFHFFDHWIELHWDFLETPGTIPLDTSLSPTSSDSFGSFFSLSGSPGSATLLCSSSGGCTIVMPNYVDDLDSKFIEMEIEFGVGGPVGSLTGTVGVSGSDAEDGPTSCDPPFVSDNGVNLMVISIFCEPNPDSETITIPFSPSDTATISAIWVETESFSGFFAVGGTSIPIDTTSLLLAGASVNVWMIPVILSAAGFGILIARKI